MPLYFAYGSNMDVAAMAERCPRSARLGVARLPRHRFALTRQGLATVERSARGDVWGLLWNLALADVPALDRYEEVGRGLYAKRTIPVIRKDAAAVGALAYVARDGLPGPAAPPSYGASVLRAAREAGLPHLYCATIEAAFAGRALSRVSP